MPDKIEKLKVKKVRVEKLEDLKLSSWGERGDDGKGGSEDPVGQVGHGFQVTTRARRKMFTDSAALSSGSVASRISYTRSLLLLAI